MRDVRYQYALLFGTLGTIVPFFSVYLAEAGFTRAQIGYAWSIFSLASVISPALLTLLADAKIDPRWLLAGASAVVAGSLFVLPVSVGVMSIFLVWTVYCLSATPTYPLTDGIHFSQQRRRREAGEPQTPYHFVRAWGTVGYLVPGVLLFYPLKYGMKLSSVLVVGAAIAVVAAMQALRLYDPRPAEPEKVADDARDNRRPPTLGALSALFSRRFAAFTVAVILMNMVGSIHGAFYPIYARERVGLEKEWIGQAVNVGTIVEIVIVFSCGWAIRRIGLKPLLVLSMVGIALRMALIAAFTSRAIAIGTQVTHGLLVLAVGVLPQAIFDQCADDDYRHSMQGVLVMSTYAARAIAGVIFGRIAQWDLSAAFYGSSIMCVAAALLVAFAFSDRAPAPARPHSAPEEEAASASELVESETIER